MFNASRALEALNPSAGFNSHLQVVPVSPARFVLEKEGLYDMINISVDWTATGGKLLLCKTSVQHSCV